jgi:hypothetical protein
MRATVDCEEYFQFQHGHGRLKLIERLTAAHRAGELPDILRHRSERGAAARQSRDTS